MGTKCVKTFVVPMYMCTWKVMERAFFRAEVLEVLEADLPRTGCGRGAEGVVYRIGMGWVPTNLDPPHDQFNKLLNRSWGGSRFVGTHPMPILSLSIYIYIYY